MADAGNKDTATRRNELLRRRLVAENLSATNGTGTSRRPREIEKGYPLSPGQRRMWFLQQLNPASTAYNICVAFTISGPLDGLALRDGLRAVVGKHEILRTTYRADSAGTPEQVVHPDLSVPFSCHDLSSVTGASPDQRAAAIAAQESRHVFDLATEAPLRVTLVRRGEEEHTFILIAHHIAWDDDSWDVFFGDLMDAYEAIRAGTSFTWDEQLPQYADLAAGQGAMPAGVDYWRQQLTPVPEPLELPGERGRRIAGDETGIQRSINFSEPLLTGVRELATSERATPFMVLLAVFSGLLHRYTGAVDFVVGSPVVNRDFPAAERLIGYFGNIVPLRFRLDRAETFRALVRRTREVCTHAFAHQDVDFEQIVRQLNPERSDGILNIFNVLFAVRSPAAGALRTEKFSAVQQKLHNGTAQFPLSVVIETSGDNLSVEVTHLSNVVPTALAAQFVRHFELCIGRALHDPDQQISSVELVSGEDQVPAEWGRRVVEAAPLPLPELVEAQVARSPHRIALTTGDVSLTYRELNCRANRVARLLRSSGVGAESVVGLLLPRSADLVVALLGVLKAGAAYLPIDPDYPPARIGFMVTDAAPTAMLCTTGLRAGLSHRADASWLALDEAGIQDELAALDAADLGPDERAPLGMPGNAYVIYTSGSTGTPKGVLITHQGLANLLVSMQSRLRVRESDTLLAVTTVAFDIAALELFVPLLHGARIHVATREDVRDPGRLAGLVSASGATLMQATPSLWQTVLPEAGQALSGLRVLTGGEELAPSLAADLCATCAEVTNVYGPTETTIWSAAARVSGEPGPIPIGGPLDNTRLYVLDDGLRRVPTGVAGELYIGGAGLARGYLGRYALTAERFVADPFGPAGERMYRTGDLARWNVDGVLEYRGRRDDQVKIRGFRIEPGEIQTVLAGHGSVARCAVLVRTDGPATKHIVAYVVAAAGAEVDGAVLRAHLGRFLPDHMMPAAFVALEELPMTANGKLDRRGLPAPDFAGAVSAVPEARTGAEQALSDLFADVLKLPAAGLDDSFFELGGDSILAIQLAHRARSGGVIISPNQVFEHRTVRGLAGVARAATESAAAPGPAGGVGAVPLVPGIRALLERAASVDRFARAAVLNTPAGLGLDRLRSVVQAVLERHDALRSRLRRAQPGWSFEVLAPDAAGARRALRRIEVAGDWASDRFARLVDEQFDAATARLDPAAGGMVQLVWFDAGDAGGRLLVVAHQVIVDAPSWRILIHDLAAADRQAHSDRPPTLEPVPTSLREWARGLEEQSRDPGRTAELPRWQAVLETPDPPLGRRRLDPAHDLFSTAREVRVSLPAETTAALLSTVAEAFYAGVHEVLLAAVALAVARWRDQAGTDAAPLLITTEGEGRAQHTGAGAGLSRTVGRCSTQFPVRLDLAGMDVPDAFEGGPAAGAVLKQVKETLRSAPDGGLGFGLLRHLNPATAAALSGYPTPQISFSYLGRFELSGKAWTPATEFAALRAAADPDLPMPACLEITVVAEDRPDGARLAAVWAFPAAVLTGHEVDQLAQLWCAALRGLVQHTDRPDSGGHTPSDLPLVSLNQNQLDALEARWRTP